MSVKVVAAINGMNKLGHDAHLYKHQGKVWWRSTSVCSPHSKKSKN